MVCIVSQSGFFTVTFLGFRQGDKWLCVHSGYQHKSNYFVSAIQSGLPFLLFLERVIKSAGRSWVLGSGRLSSPHHVYFIKKSTISESSDECVIWDSSTVQECADAVKPFFFSLVALVSDSYFAFTVPHSHDCLYTEDKSAWQRRPLYFSSDGKIVWTVHAKPLLQSMMMVACVFQCTAIAYDAKIRMFEIKVLHIRVGYHSVQANAAKKSWFYISK